MNRSKELGIKWLVAVSVTVVSVAYSTCWDESKYLCKQQGDEGTAEVYCDGDPDPITMTSYVDDDVFISDVSALSYWSPYGYTDYNSVVQTCSWGWHIYLSPACRPPDGDIETGFGSTPGLIANIGAEPYCPPPGE